MVKKNSMEYGYEKLIEEKFKHSKMDNLVYTELQMQNYLMSEDLTTRT